MKKYHIFKINLNTLNIVSLLLMVVMILVTIIISPKLSIAALEIFSNYKTMFLFFPCMILYMILHELFHALGYINHGADARKITFGMELEKGVFYCLCKQDINKKTILYALAYPLFFLGIVTYIVSIIFNLPVLLLLSITNISGAAGDIMYLLFISKLDKNIIFSELDDGTSFAIKTKENPDKVKHIGLIYDGTKSEIPRKDFKTLKVSKGSFIMIVICVISVILGFIL